MFNGTSSKVCLFFWLPIVSCSWLELKAKRAEEDDVLFYFSASKIQRAQCLRAMLALWLAATSWCVCLILLAGRNTALVNNFCLRKCHVGGSHFWSPLPEKWKNFTSLPAPYLLRKSMFGAWILRELTEGERKNVLCFVFTSSNEIVDIGLMQQLYMPVHYEEPNGLYPSILLVSFWVTRSKRWEK